jgi:hypothetical protein
MRKLGKANIRAFILFTFIVLCVIAVFSFGIYKVIINKKTEYKVSSGSFIYEKNNKSILLKSSGIIYKNWDNNYYLKLDQTDTKYNLGKEAVCFNINDYQMYIYGDVYQVFDNGLISKKSKETKIIKKNANVFYKLADRKYLIIANNIVDNDNIITAKNYLIVSIDKAGNALLMNDELNVKTLNNLILKTNSFNFDIANEKLIFPNKEIDLKKINGSTNEYVEEKKDDSNQVNNNSSITNNTVTNNTNNNINQNFQKSASIKNIVPGITTIDISYFIQDPGNEYTSVFLNVYDGIETKKIQLNKDDTLYNIRNLNPNSQYTISLGYSYLLNNNMVEEIKDAEKIQTLKPSFNLSITKVTSDKIYFNLKLDSKYNLESGKLVLYSDDIKQQEMNIDTIAAISSNGWDSYFNYTMLGYEILLKLENAIYNGNSINVDTQAIYIND